MSYARRKRAVVVGLSRPDWQQYLDELLELPGRVVINPLFGLLHDTRMALRWRAVTAFGLVTARLADENMESARVIMRRLLWNLNDESGGIGWGSPEAMGECMANHAGLAQEYAQLLIAFSQPGKTQLEHAQLQVGVMWGLARLADKHPGFFQTHPPDLLEYLSHTLTPLRGHAAWVAGLLQLTLPEPLTEALMQDTSLCEIYFDRQITGIPINQLWREPPRNQTTLIY